MVTSSFSFSSDAFLTTSEKKGEPVLPFSQPLKKAKLKQLQLEFLQYETALSRSNFIK
jgi:hypothetical protein